MTAVGELVEFGLRERRLHGGPLFIAGRNRVVAAEDRQYRAGHRLQRLPVRLARRVVVEHGEERFDVEASIGAIERREAGAKLPGIGPVVCQQPRGVKRQVQPFAHRRVHQLPRLGKTGRERGGDLRSVVLQFLVGETQDVRVGGERIRRRRYQHQPRDLRSVTADDQPGRLARERVGDDDDGAIGARLQRTHDRHYQALVCEVGLERNTVRTQPRRLGPEFDLVTARREHWTEDGLFGEAVEPRTSMEEKEPHDDRRLLPAAKDTDYSRPASSSAAGRGGPTDPWPVERLLEEVGTLHEAALDPARWPEVARVVRQRMTRDVQTQTLSSEQNGGTPPMVQPTSVSAARLDDGIGYVRVAFFPGASGRPFVNAFSRALAELKAPQRLIVDLRGNAGGFVGSLWLMSHLVPDRLPVGYSLTRRAQDLGWTKDRLPVLKRLPASKLAEIWMFLRFAVWNKDRSVALWTQGLGDQPYHGRIVILTNEHTASSAEMVAAFAAEAGAATIVGARTKGEVLGGANYRVSGEHRLRLPAAAWYTWRGEVVEGRGVSPHSDVALSLPDLQRGVDSQLVRARQLLQAQ
jgi:hypothetical protein